MLEHCGDICLSKSHTSVEVNPAAGQGPVIWNTQERVVCVQFVPQEQSRKQNIAMGSCLGLSGHGDGKAGDMAQGQVQNMSPP